MTPVEISVHVQSQILYAISVLYLVTPHGNRNHRYATLALQKHLNLLSHWYKIWKLKVNHNKSQCTLFKRCKGREICGAITMEGHQIQYTDCVKYLGLYMDRNLNWRHHIDELRTKMGRTWGSLWKIKGFKNIPVKQKYMIYSQLIRSFITYGSSSWSAASDYLIEGVQRKENKILRKITRANPYTPNIEIKHFLGHVDVSRIIQEVRAKELRMLKEIVDTF